MTINDQIKQLNRLYENALSILNGFHSANFSDVSFVEVELNNGNGSTTTLTLPSNINLDRKIKALQNTVNELTTLTGGTTLAVSITDPSVRELYISSFERSIRALQASDYSVDTNLKIENNTLLESLSDPICKVSVKLPNDLSDTMAVRVFKYVLTSSDKDGEYQNLLNSVTSSSLKTFVENQLTSNSVAYKVYDNIVFTDPTKVRYYGNFSVIQYEVQNNGDFRALLDRRTYSDSDVAITDSKELAIGNMLRTADGQAIYEIVDINLINGVYVTLRKKGGFKSIETGLETLSYHDVSDIEKNISIPIEGGERSFLFFAPINRNTSISGEWSRCIPFSSVDYTVQSDGVSKTFDNYFNENVLAISRYLKSQVADQNISRTLALELTIPQLSEDNFEVVQINSHLSKTGEFDKIKRLSEEKNTLSAQIDSIGSEITRINSRISNTTYSSEASLDQDRSLLKSKQVSRSEKQKALDSIIKEISTVGSTSSANKVAQKYRVIGFWNVDEPVDSDGAVQRIVQYKVRYKYVPSNSSASTSVSVGKINGLDGAFSPFTEILTTPLEKEYNSNTDKYEWEVNDITNSSKNNINQLDIPISYGESVVIQVKAISEAGYPSNPQSSEWSDELRIEFPTSLAQNETISAIVSQNSEDERILKMSNFLDDKGVTEHIKDSFILNEAYIAHNPDKISSGFKENGVLLNLYEYLVFLTNKVASLEQTVLRQSVAWGISIIDDLGNVFPVSNRASLKLFAGYYTDDVDVSNNSEYGTVVTKTFYLSIKNTSAISGDLLTLSSGTLTNPTGNLNYVDSPLSTILQELVTQKNGQILYLRKNDLSGAFEHYVNDTALSSNAVPTTDINSGALATLKNVVQFFNNAPSEVALIPTANSGGYVAIGRNHPLYQAYLSNPTGILQDLTDEFTRVQNFTNILRNSENQKDINSVGVAMFKEDDKYLVGADSCGSFLFLQPQDQASLQVPTSDSSAPFTVAPNEEIRIPIVFQFRMTDALGRLNGDGTKSLSGGNVTYVKRVGFDLYAGQEIKFDIEVKAQFRPTIKSNRNANSSSPVNTNNTNPTKFL